MLVKFNRPRVLGFQDKILVPGLNDLTPEMVADMQDDEVLAAKFDSGELEIMDIPAEKGKPKNGIAALLAATPKNAVALAEQTVDMSILETWLAKEKRAEVKKAIKAQVKKIRAVEFRDAKAKGQE